MWVIFVFVLIGAKCLERRGAVQLHFEICCWWLPTMCEWQYYWVGVANECLANLADWNDFFKKIGAPSGCLWQLGRLLMRRINICFIFEKGKLCANLMSVRRLGGGEKKKKRSHLSLVEHECDGRQFVKVSVSCANAAVFFCYRLLVQVCAHPKLIITQQESVGGKKKKRK